MRSQLDHQISTLVISFMGLDENLVFTTPEELIASIGQTADTTRGKLLSLLCVCAGPWVYRALFSVDQTGNHF